MPEVLDGGSKVLPKNEEKIKEPEDYAVILLNDDFTTREFVVAVLKIIFHKSQEDAIQLML
jgi:ATP-dependent Clp protease adaptor protein ClpS